VGEISFKINSLSDRYHQFISEHNSPIMIMMMLTFVFPYCIVKHPVYFESLIIQFLFFDVFKNALQILHSMLLHAKQDEIKKRNDANNSAFISFSQYLSMIEKNDH